MLLLDLRRPTAPLRAARVVALAAVLTILCALTAASAAHASNGEIRAFGQAGGGAPDGMQYVGPTAVDTGDGSSFVADLSENDYFPRIRKYDATGAKVATVLPPASNPSDPNGLSGEIMAMAVDPTEHRLYVLMGATGSPDTMRPNDLASMTILAYSTQQSGSTLVAPSDLSSGVLIDFRTAGGWVDTPEGIAVDPTTHKVAIAGVADADATDPTGVLQYVTDHGVLSTRVSGLGAGVDPDAGSADHQPQGLAIGTGGKVYIPVTAGQDVKIYSLPKEGNTPTLVATDPSANHPLNYGTYSGNFGYGVPLAVSADGATVWLAEGTGDVGSGGVRGFSTTDGSQVISYGGGTTSCNVPNRATHLNIAAGVGQQVVVTSAYTLESLEPDDKIVHVFGPGGTGCPMPQGLFTVDGRGDGSVTVTKGQPIAFDASPSDLRGGAASEVDWDFDGTGAYATSFTGAPAALTTTHKFLQVGTVRVGVKVHIAGGVTTDPVFHTITVVSPKPTASFTASTRTPAAGGAVTFDAGNSLDPAGSPTGTTTHTLASYRWDFGDGSALQEVTGATVTHAFANGGAAAVTRTVKLVVVNGDGVASDAVQQAITVAGQPQAGPPPPPATTPTTPVNPIGRTQVTTTFPNAGVSAASVDPRGTLTLTVSCPKGGATCEGTIALTTKVTKKVKGRKKTTTVKLGTVSFSVAAGRDKAVKLKLSSAGKALLKKQKKLSAGAAITLKVGGKSSTRTKSLTLKASSAKKG